MEKINKDKFFQAIEQISKQNPLTKDETKEIITNAVIKGFHSKHDPDADLELIIDEDNKIFKLFNNSILVVEDEVAEDKNSAIEISLKNAKKINSNVKVGDFIRQEVNFAFYSRSIIQQIKQIFTQTIRAKKKEVIFIKHKNIKGQMIDVVVSSITPSFVIFQLKDGTSAFMPSQLRNPNITLAVGQHLQVYVEDVLKDSKDAQIIVSNGSKQLIKRILEEEVPEIASQIVEIISISRQPGVRSKVAVKSNDDNIDPIGTIIGFNGNRIKSIIQKLEGEKLDIVLYSSDINIFIANSLSPAKVASIVEKRNNDDVIIENQKIAIVPDNHLSLAIGKRGSNAKLAVELTSIGIDVISISDAKEKEIEIIYNAGLTKKEIQNIIDGKNLNVKQFGRKSPSISYINNNEFDSSIETFKESMMDDENIQSNNDIDDSMFSDEQLKEMEQAFEIDENFKDSDNS